MPVDIGSILGAGSYDDDDDGFDLPEVSVAFEQALSLRAASQALPPSPVKPSRPAVVEVKKDITTTTAAMITPVRLAFANASSARERPFGITLPTMQELDNISSGGSQSGRSSSEGSSKETPHLSNRSQHPPATPIVKGGKRFNARSAPLATPRPPPTLRERLDKASNSSSSSTSSSGGRARSAAERGLLDESHRSVRRPPRKAIVSSESDSESACSARKAIHRASEPEDKSYLTGRRSVRRRPARPIKAEDEDWALSAPAPRQSARLAAGKARAALANENSEFDASAESDVQLEREPQEHPEHLDLIELEPAIVPESDMRPEQDIAGTEPELEDEDPLCEMRSQATPSRRVQPAEPQPAWDFENPEAELLLTRLSARLARLEDRMGPSLAIANAVTPRDQPDLVAVENRLSGVESMATDLETTQTRVGELKDLLEALFSQHARAKAEIENTCKTLAERINHTETLNQDNCERLGAQLTTWAAGYQANAIKMQSAHQADVKLLVDSVNKMSAEVDNTMKAGLAVTRTRLENLACGFNVQRDKVIALERRLETGVASLETTRIAEAPRLEARVASLEARIATALRTNQTQQTTATLTRISSDTAFLFNHTAALLSAQTELANKHDVFCSKMQTAVDKIVEQLNRDSQARVEERARVAYIENTLALVQSTLREERERLVALQHLQGARAARVSVSSVAPQSDATAGANAIRRALTVSTDDVMRPLGEQVTSRELQLHRRNATSDDHMQQLLEQLQDQHRQLATDIDSMRTNHARLAAADRADLRSLRADHATVSSTVSKRAGEVDTRVQSMSRELAELREFVREMRAREKDEARARDEAKQRDEARLRELENTRAAYESKIADARVALFQQRDGLSGAAETPQTAAVVPAVIAPAQEPTGTDSVDTHTGTHRRRRRADDDVDRRPAKRIAVAAVGVWKWLRGP
ncbi:hypothetical protein HDU87_002028 [Geranomyces variabilis]|uniref:Uncharacterized protein n=1 Tax=Geranomyces variabilis TaxID=109894 RepID=A0AAD5XP38_9FUNG|nr:hypothetical protein HDU87_002028 [Geranomyces variabilis]